MGPPASKNSHYKAPISNAMALPANRIITTKTFRTPISQAMGLLANKILTVKHQFHIQWARQQTKIFTIKKPFHMQWAHRQTKLSLQSTHFASKSTLKLKTHVSHAKDVKNLTAAKRLLQVLLHTEIS